MTKKTKTYYDHSKEAVKPIAQRKATIEGRGGDLRTVRRHHLDPTLQQNLLDKMTSEGKFVSPYKTYKGYWGATEALARLGTNQFHPMSEVIKSFQECMSDEASKNKHGQTAWDQFKNKKPRSKKRGLDYLGRLLQNIAVLQRIGGDDPYGLKLVQVGACIDIKADEHGSPLVCLRTDIPEGEPVAPINEMKKRDCPRSVESVPSRISFPTLVAATKRRRKDIPASVTPAVSPSESVQEVNPVSEKV